MMRFIKKRESLNESQTYRVYVPKLHMTNSDLTGVATIWTVTRGSKQWCVYSDVIKNKNFFSRKNSFFLLVRQPKISTWNNGWRATLEKMMLEIFPQEDSPHEWDEDNSKRMDQTDDRSSRFWWDILHIANIVTAWGGEDLKQFNKKYFLALIISICLGH